MRIPPDDEMGTSHEPRTALSRSVPSEKGRNFNVFPDPTQQYSPDCGNFRDFSMIRNFIRQSGGV
jgi:hypothetical protein